MRIMSSWAVLTSIPWPDLPAVQLSHPPEHQGNSAVIVLDLHGQTVRLNAAEWGSAEINEHVRSLNKIYETNWGIMINAILTL